MDPVDNYQRAVWADTDAARYLAVKTSITLDCLSAHRIPGNRPVGTHQHARSAADALVGVNQHGTIILETMHCSRETCLYTLSLPTVLTPDRHRESIILLDPDASGVRRGAVLQRLQRVVIARVMRLAVYATESATDTQFLSNKHLSHVSTRQALEMEAVNGNRLPQYSITTPCNCQMIGTGISRV